MISLLASLIRQVLIWKTFKPTQRPVPGYKPFSRNLFDHGNNNWIRSLNQYSTESNMGRPAEKGTKGNF